MQSLWIAWLVAISSIMLTSVMALAQSGTDSGGNAAEKPSIGDFYSGNHQELEIQIIDERQTIRDFREAPTAPRMIQLPPPPGTEPTPGSGDAHDESAVVQSASADDGSPEMRAAWDEWHKRVASAILERYSHVFLAAFTRSKPLAAVAAFTVTRDGHIINARLTQPNMNPIFNSVCLTAVNSLDGNLQILQFPPGSHRMTVDKAATFNQPMKKTSDHYNPLLPCHGGGPLSGPVR